MKRLDLRRLGDGRGSTRFPARYTRARPARGMALRPGARIANGIAAAPKRPDIGVTPARSRLLATMKGRTGLIQRHLAARFIAAIQTAFAQLADRHALVNHVARAPFSQRCQRALHRAFSDGHGASLPLWRFVGRHQFWSSMPPLERPCRS